MEKDINDMYAEDPDTRGQVRLRLVYNQYYPLALGRIECLAGLPLTLEVESVDKQAGITDISLIITGKVLDLAEFQMKLPTWEEQYPGLKAMSMEDILNARSTPSPASSAEGADEPDR